MFTGIIEETGTVLRAFGAAQHSLSITADAVLNGTKIGDSIAVNGICLTVTSLGSRCFDADVMPETAHRTNIASLRTGGLVNLERAMAADGRFGGHIVSGHIDCTATLISMKPTDNAIVAQFELKENKERYIIEKGSITIDGISLTVVAVEGRRFSVSLIPHTRASTNLQALRPGMMVNIETDVIARYIEKLMQPSNAAANASTSDSKNIASLLTRSGFVK